MDAEKRKPLSVAELRELEYAGRRPDPFGFPPYGNTDTGKTPEPTASACRPPPPPEKPPSRKPNPFSLDSMFPLQGCLYCSMVGEHATRCCPYTKRVPKGAAVLDGAVVVCRECGLLFSDNCCGQDEGRAILKFCSNCLRDSHWAEACPRPRNVGDVVVTPGPNGSSFMLLDFSSRC